MVDLNIENDLLLEQQTLQLIFSQVTEHVDPSQLTSISAESCVTGVSVPTMVCYVCSRLPVDPVMDENCE